MKPARQKAIERRSEKERVREYLGEAADFVRGLSDEELNDGKWFEKLISFAMGNYAKKANAEYFRQKYPDLPPDAIVAARIRTAVRYASVEGSVTSLAHTGVAAAAIGKRGGTSRKAAMHAGAAAMMADLVFTSALQLRLAHDIATLYGVPIDLGDPDDVEKLVRVAFVIKAGEVGASAALRATPAIVRPLVKKFYSGATLAAFKGIPVIGKYLLQRNVIKFAIPAVGVPLTVVLNRQTTKATGKYSSEIFRSETRIKETASRLVNQTRDHEALAWVVWLMVQSDGVLEEPEWLLFHHMTRSAKEVGTPAAKFDELRSVIEVDEESVLKLLAGSGKDMKALHSAAETAAAIDGKIDGKELACLKRMARVTGIESDVEELRELARRWR